MATLSEDLRPLSVRGAGLSMAAFALGVVVVAMFDPLRLHRDYSDLFESLWFLPLAITPVTYLPGFLFLEAAIPWRSRQMQIGAGFVAGLTFMLVVAALLKAAAVIGETLVFEDWLGWGMMWLLALGGPFVVAWALVPLERRLMRSGSYAS